MSGQVVPLQANRKLESGARRSDWDSPRALMGRAAGQARGVSGILNLNLRPSLSISKFKFNLKLWSTAAAAAAGPPALPAAAGAAHHVSGLLCKALSRATSLVLRPDLSSRASRPNDSLIGQPAWESVSLFKFQAVRRALTRTVRLTTGPWVLSESVQVSVSRLSLAGCPRACDLVITSLHSSAHRTKYSVMGHQCSGRTDSFSPCTPGFETSQSQNVFCHFFLPRHRWYNVPYSSLTWTINLDICTWLNLIFLPSAREGIFQEYSRNIPGI